MLMKRVEHRSHLVDSWILNTNDQLININVHAKFDEFQISYEQTKRYVWMATRRQCENRLYGL